MKTMFLKVSMTQRAQSMFTRLMASVGIWLERQAQSEAFQRRVDMATGRNCLDRYY
jgi:hypothetical protein